MTMKKKVTSKKESTTNEQFKAGISHPNETDMMKLGACLIASGLVARGSSQSSVVHNSLDTARKIFDAEE